MIQTFGLEIDEFQELIKILDQFKTVKKVFIFGSRAKENFKKGSDIDLAIINSDFSEIELPAIKGAFEESNLPYSVDVVNYLNLPKSVKEHVDRVGKEIYFRKNKVH